MPVLAVWVDGRLFLSAGERTRKARNLARHSRCVVTVEEEPVDLVVEGDASIVRDDATLARVADAYASIYGWQVTVRQGAFHDAGGARPRVRPRTTYTRSRRPSPSAFPLTRRSSRRAGGFESHRRAGEGRNWKMTSGKMTARPEGQMWSAAASGWGRASPAFSFDIEPSHRCPFHATGRSPR